jgi:hypothetical protein
MADEDKNDITKHPAFVQLTGVVTQLGKNMQSLQGLLATQGTNLEKVVKAIGEGGGKPPKDKDKPEDKPPSEKELDEMSQSQLVGHMFKSFRGMLDGFGKEIHTKIDGLSTTFEKKEFGSEIERAKAAHKDFDDWIPEIKDIMTSNPNLKIEQAYTLVRSGNVEKTKQMDDKYKVGLEDDKTKEKPAFGGLMPTSGSPPRETNDDGTPKTVTQGQAAELAWEQTFGDNPSLAGPDSED